MTRFAFAIMVGLLVIAPLQAQPTKTPQFVKVFREVVAGANQHTVRVKLAGKDAALGVVVGEDGWILTKHSEIKGGKLTCKLPDGEEVEAKIVNFDTPNDLAMLKVEAKDLKPIEWCDSKVCRLGHWVASPGAEEDPVAIGVVSVLSRQMPKSKYSVPPSSLPSYLGVVFDTFGAGVHVEEIVAKSPAETAGLKAGDHILALNGKEVDSIEDFRALLAKHKPGDEIKIKLVRNEAEQELKAKLGTPPGAKGGKSRSDIQNSMGSKLSERRAGFPVVLQHDSVLKPTDCGGPLVNLEGKVIGINICRAGRTESYAIPSEVVRPLLEKLKVERKEKEK